MRDTTKAFSAHPIPSKPALRAIHFQASERRRKLRLATTAKPSATSARVDGSGITDTVIASTVKSIPIREVAPPVTNPNRPMSPGSEYGVEVGEVNP